MSVQEPVRTYGWDSRCWPRHGMYVVNSVSGWPLNRKPVYIGVGGNVGLVSMCVLTVDRSFRNYRYFGDPGLGE